MIDSCVAEYFQRVCVNTFWKEQLVGNALLFLVLMLFLPYYQVAWWLHSPPYCGPARTPASL